MMIVQCDVCDAQTPAPIVAGEWGFPRKWFQQQPNAIDGMVWRHACSAKCRDELKVQRRRAEAAAVTLPLNFDGGGKQNANEKLFD